MNQYNHFSMQIITDFVFFCIVIFLCPMPQHIYTDSIYASTNVNWGSLTDNKSEELHITYMGTPYFPNASECGYIELMLENRFNIQFEPVFLDLNAYQQTKPLMLAAGSAPDVWGEADPITLQQAIRHNLIMEIPYDLIKQHAPNYVKIINSFAPQSWLFSYAQGKNYGVPTIWTDGIYPYQCIWRKDWLNNVGIKKTPETLEEMYAALYMFRHCDPDKNGKKDTYGLTTNYDWWWMQFSEIFGASGVLPYDWTIHDGKIVWGGVLPETKSTLKLLHKWYADELIDPDFIINKNEDAEERAFVSGRVGYACGATSHGAASFDNFDETAPASLVSKLHTLCPDAQITIGVLPLGPQGKRGIRVWGGGGNIFVFSARLNNHPQKILRILVMWEQMCTDPNLFIESKAGKRTVHWDYRNNANASGGLKLLPPYDNPHRATAAVVNLSLGGGPYWNPCGAMPIFLEQFYSQKEIAFNQAHRNPALGLKDVFLKPDVVPSAGKYLRVLRERQKTVFAQIIRGDKPIEAFDNFVREWYDRGGQKMTDDANLLYKQLSNISQKVITGD